jgi:hypothetical protein
MARKRSILLLAIAAAVLGGCARLLNPLLPATPCGREGEARLEAQSRQCLFNAAVNLARGETTMPLPVDAS